MPRELSIDPCRVQNRNVNAPPPTDLDHTQVKETTTCKASSVSQELALILAFAVVLAALALSACEKKTETTEPSASPTKPLATQSPQPTIGESPVTVSPAGPSATSSPDYTGWDVGDRGIEDQEVVPEFPWPPPKASASDMIPRELLVGNVTHPTLATVVQAIESALQEAGYGEKSYYSVPGGFAMASRIEQINQDGTAKGPADRWSLEVPPMRKFSFSAYLTALFTARPGYYRVIVFVVTSHPFSQADAKVTSEEAQVWVSSGLNALPEDIASRDYSSAHNCTALIYEFKQIGKHTKLMDPSQLTGKTHLNKAGLMAAFAKRP